jgi:hypothetical protein
MRRCTPREQKVTATFSASPLRGRRSTRCSAAGCTRTPDAASRSCARPLDVHPPVRLSCGIADRPSGQRTSHTCCEMQRSPRRPSSRLSQRRAPCRRRGESHEGAPRCRRHDSRRRDSSLISQTTTAARGGRRFRAPKQAGAEPGAAGGTRRLPPSALPRTERSIQHQAAERRQTFVPARADCTSRATSTHAPSAARNGRAFRLPRRRPDDSQPQTAARARRHPRIATDGRMPALLPPSGPGITRLLPRIVCREGRNACGCR